MHLKRCLADVTSNNKKRACKRKTNIFYCHNHRITIPCNPFMDRVTDELFIGCKRSAHDFKNLQFYGITHIINCAHELQHMTTAYDERITWLWLPMYDSINTSDVTSHVESAIQFINAAISSGHKVLIHCAAGRSRSSSILIAYLMFLLHITFDAALKLVQNKRPCCKPNSTFEAQLRSFDFQSLNILDS